MTEAVGIAFYTKQTYKCLQERADDPEVLHDSYKDWLKSFKQVLATFREAGIKAEPYEINLEELRLWCLQNNRPNTKASRGEFVAYMLNNR